MKIELEGTLLKMTPENKSPSLTSCGQ